MKINTLLTIAIAAALGLFLLAAGCSSTEPPACNPDAPAGAWTASLDGHTEVLTLNADHTFAETYNDSEAHGTWVADSGNITFTLSDGSTDAPQPYWLVDGDLVIGAWTGTAVCGGGK